MSSHQSEKRERQILERAGVFPKGILSSREEQIEDFFDAFYTFIKSASSEEKRDPLLERIEKLEETVEELKKEKELRRVSLKADVIYSKFKEDLEKEHLGQIVAIDLESEQIVGFGNSILEAYRNAKEETSKEEFSYRRVGSNYVHKL
jgi:hypothetical protein